MNASASLSISLLTLIMSLMSAPKAQIPSFTWPVDAYQKRPLLLTFGMNVTPTSENNPIVPPERFSGYHSALDIEIYPDEINKKVTVNASCAGKILTIGMVNGYGGVLVQSCKINNQEVTILYGHLDPDDFLVKFGDSVKAGDDIGILAPHKTAKSGFNRKHLHLQIHRGTNIVLRGYVSREEDLAQYIDPQSILAR